ncbi:MAG: type II toxin-antitoxin system VapC family toxin [Salinibacterium sp.]|nr:type II toxin-antitoxin system VapC family toxin [Salinibacterium sp.]
MGLIYLDSCMLIYAVEDHSPRGDAVRRHLHDPHSRLAISPLVVMECLVGPLKRDNLALRDQFTNVFARCDMLSLGLPEFARAAELRARHSLRTADALHLAAAQLNGCEALWTNDSRLTAASSGLAVDRVTA